MSIVRLALCTLYLGLTGDAVQTWPLGFIPGWNRQAVNLSQVAEIESILSYKTNLTNWVLRGCSEKLAEERLVELRGNLLTSLLAAISAEGDQRTLNLCFIYIDNFIHQMNQCNTLQNNSQVARATAFKTQLQLARHHRWMVTNGQDPLGLYSVNISSTFSPPKDQPPLQVVDWFLAKAATLDFFTHKAIDSKAGLDDTYLLTKRLDDSMARVVNGFGLGLTSNFSDPDTMYAQFALQSLQAHLDQLGALLHAFGANVDVIDPIDVTKEVPVETPVLVDPKTRRLRELEANLTYSVSFQPLVIRSCSATQAHTGVKKLEDLSLIALLSGISSWSDAKYVNQCMDQAESLRRMIRACDALSAKNSTLLSRVNEVEGELHAVAHHKWMVRNGQNPLGLYTLSKPSDFVPKNDSNLSQKIEWLLAKVTSLNFLTYNAVTSEQGINETYFSAAQVRVTMQQMLDSMGTVNNRSSELASRALAVIHACDIHVRLLESLLFVHGARQPPPEPEPEQLQAVEQEVAEVVDVSEITLSYNTSFSPSSLASCSKIEVERRLAELEEKTLTALLALVSRVGDPKTSGAARNATANLKRHIIQCNVTTWRDLLDRTNTIQSELETATHHRWMVGKGDDSNGLYRLDTSLTPDNEIDFIEMSAWPDWFLAKATSVDFLTHEAIDENGDLSYAYQLNCQLAQAMETMIQKIGAGTIASETSDAKAFRVTLVMQTLIDHIANLQALLRKHGAAS